MKEVINTMVALTRNEEGGAKAYAWDDVFLAATFVGGMIYLLVKIDCYFYNYLTS